MLDEPLIPFDIVGITTKVTTENLTLWTVNAITTEWNLQILLNVKNFGEKHLWLWHPLGLILKIMSGFYHFDNIGIIITTFDFANR